MENWQHTSALSLVSECSWPTRTWCIFVHLDVYNSSTFRKELYSIPTSLHLFNEISSARVKTMVYKNWCRLRSLWSVLCSVCLRWATEWSNMFYPEHLICPTGRTRQCKSVPLHWTKYFGGECMPCVCTARSQESFFEVQWPFLIFEPKQGYNVLMLKTFGHVKDVTVDIGQRFKEISSLWNSILADNDRKAL